MPDLFEIPWYMTGVRWFNFILCCITLPALIYRVHKRWPDVVPGARFFLLSLMLFVFVTGYGSLETLYQQIQPGFRTLGASVALLWTLGGALYAGRGHVWLEKKFSGSRLVDRCRRILRGGKGSRDDRRRDSDEGDPSGDRSGLY